MIQVINRAFDILEFLAKTDRETSLSEIADHLGLNHGTCANILKTMVQRRYVEQAGPKKGYRLGAMTYLISGNPGYRKDLVEAAREEVDRLTVDLNENSLLAVLQNENRLCLYTAQAKHDLQVNTSPEKHAYNTATGRLLLAFLPDNEREAFVKKYGLPQREHLWEEAMTHGGFADASRKIRQAGYATQRTNAYIVGLALPLHRADKVIASISVFLPEMRFNGQESTILSRIKMAAETIDRRLSQA
ncbi:MAG: helix-turn-helix domain-containing protein [Sphingobacteriaceae bacterium]|nr:helix-turn-helix domain-containing protein [Cytophagaceae bacterium]